MNKFRTAGLFAGLAISMAGLLYGLLASQPAKVSFPNYIEPVAIVPTRALQKPTPEPTECIIGMHQPQAGETLVGIASQYGISFAELYEANRQNLEKDFWFGPLKIPCSSSTLTPTP